jgi:hypothetical protein
LIISLCTWRQYGEGEVMGESQTTMEAHAVVRCSATSTVIREALKKLADRPTIHRWATKSRAVHRQTRFKVPAAPAN